MGRKGVRVPSEEKLVVGNPDMSKVLEDTSSNSMDHSASHGESEDEEKEEAHSH